MVGTAWRAGGSEGTLQLLKRMYLELLNLVQFKLREKLRMQNFYFPFLLSQSDIYYFQIVIN